jgi:hypothetical protein
MKMYLLRCGLVLLVFVLFIAFCTLLIGQTAPPQNAGAPAAAKSAPGSARQPGDWPKEARSGEMTFKVHLPQLESWDGIRASAYCAIELIKKEKASPVYGVALLTARTDIDKDARTVSFEDLKLTKVEFPSDKANASLYMRILQNSILPKTRQISLDQFEAAIAVMEAENKVEAVQLKNDPPTIIHSKVPAMLVYIDGNPVFRPVKETKLQKVLNTRPLILKDPGGKLYLHVFDGWLEAATMTGPWSVSKQPHGDVEKAMKDAIASGQVDLLEGQEDPENNVKKPSLAKGSVPVIYIATAPTELIVTEGEPKFAAIPGTSLLYAENTTGNLFRHSTQNKYYILLSGRWFRSASTVGPWEYAPYGKLPADFAKIPDDSPKENVKASVPDTPQAQEAVIANSIPQTARVNRKSAKLNPPQFDGEPQLKSVEGTSLKYAVNTATPIIQVDASTYRAVENGVWFKAQSVKGPWEVADSVPAAIYSIPPSSPLHFVTYVKVYSATADSVVVGYTPGYYGTCATHGSGFVVVYGTGYPYYPWVGSVWYGPPVTYGFGSTMVYTPWSGWSYSYGFGWTWGVPMSPMYWGWGPYPWWGPVGWGYYYPYPYYRPPYYYGGAAWGAHGAVAWGPGGWAGTTGNVYHRWGDTTAVTRRSGGYNAYTGNRWASQVGMAYNSRTGMAAAGQRAAVGNVYTGNYAYGARGAVTNTNTGNTVTGGRVTAGNAETGQSGSAAYLRGENGGVARVGDSIYAGKDGTVYRKGDSGWESNSGGGWSSVENRPAPRAQQTGQSQDKTASRTPSTQQSGSQPTAAQQPSLSGHVGGSQPSISPSIQSLDRQSAARYQGQMRTQGYQSGAYRSAGNMRGGGRRR